MTDWALLTDAYGPADEIPALLADASTDDSSAWDELWGRLCHQGTVSTASTIGQSSRSFSVLFRELRTMRIARTPSSTCTAPSGTKPCFR